MVCNVGTLASGSATSFTVVVMPSAGGLTTNTLTVSSPTPDPNPANNTATIVSMVGTTPMITVQPSDRAVKPGAKATFQVVATGVEPLSYQWLFNGTSLPGAVGPVLTLVNVGMAQAGSYSVLVTNVFGSTLSSNAVLTVLALGIDGQPQDQTVPGGATASFTVSASGTIPLSYQWLKDGVPLADGGKFSGTATASLVVSNVQAGEMGAYSVVVSNAYSSLASSNALLAVWPLLGWGRNDYSQADIPNGLTNVTGIAAGSSHSLALRADGTVMAWGAGASNTGVPLDYGQSLVPAGLSNVTAIAAGLDHSLALRDDGTVVAWGAGSTNTGAEPHYGQALVPAGLSNVVAIAAGAYHSLALKSDGTVVAWGYNSYGQTSVPDGLINAVAVAAGAYHSLALKSDGTVVAWGDNEFGQTNVPAGLTNVAAVAGGYGHSLALRADGTVMAWGNGSDGQTNVPSGLTNAVAVGGGFAHSLALRGDGTMAAWGSSSDGQTNVPSGLTNVVAIAAGNYHNLVLESDGRPALTVQPASQVAAAGKAVQMLAMAVGLQPLSYQWQWNGTNIADSTNAMFILTNVQSANSGTYAVIVSNAVGTVASSNAILTVLVPPTITAQPSNQTAVLGTNVSFTVTATGTIPLAYQWTFEGTNLAGATADTLVLTNVQYSQAGGYAVVVTNMAGSITSVVANLTVSSPGISLQISFGGQQVAISFVSELGSDYVLEYKHLLDDPAWTPLSPAVVGTGGPMTLQDTNTPVDSRYYRIRRE